jgi:hypothetical protein
MYDKAGSWKFFVSSLMRYLVPDRKFMTFPQANSDLQIFVRLFSVLLHKNE